MIHSPLHLTRRSWNSCQTVISWISKLLCAISILSWLLMKSQLIYSSIYDQMPYNSYKAKVISLITPLCMWPSAKDKIIMIETE